MGWRVGHSRLAWAGSVAAPWCMAIAVLLSITAEAEQEPAQFTSAFDRRRLIEDMDPVRRALALAAHARAVDEDGAPAPIVQVRFQLGATGGSAAPDEIEPNRTLKDTHLSFPEVDRELKGDPIVGAGPGFDTQWGVAPDGAALGRAHRSPGEAEFDPSHTMSPVRPGDEERAPSDVSLTVSDGATPAAPLEFALNSSSPTSSDGVLVVVEADPGQTTAATPSPLWADGQPDYAALIDPRDSARQMRCLAEAIYFEARSEPEQGQAAVAQVVLNRVRSGIYPDTVCGVVYQDRNRPFACQFSFACEGRSLRIEEPGPWAVATRIADEVVSGRNFNPLVAQAVNYHANYVAPFWAGYLRKVDRIGAHIFYAMRDGLNWAPGALNGHGDRP